MNRLSIKGEEYFKYKLLRERVKNRDEILELDEYDVKLFDKIINGNWEHDLACNYCGSLETKNYLKSNKVDFYDHIFNLKKCNFCELVFCDPRPNFEDIRHFYEYSNWSRKIVGIKK